MVEADMEGIIFYAQTLVKRFREVLFMHTQDQCSGAALLGLVSKWVGLTIGPSWTKIPLQFFFFVVEDFVY